MRILFAVQGRYGERVAENVRANGPAQGTLSQKCAGPVNCILDPVSGAEQSPFY